MNQKLKKELIKMSVLLGIGIVLLILFLNYAVYAGGIKFINDISGVENFLIMLTILLYPIGLFYGWRTMGNIFRGIRSADRPQEHVGSITVAITIMNLTIAFGVTVCIGWIFGIYNAVKTLFRYKKESTL